MFCLYLLACLLLHLNLETLLIYWTELFICWKKYIHNFSFYIYTILLFLFEEDFHKVLK